MYTLIKRYQPIIIYLLVLFPFVLTAQIKEVGLPFINNYSRDIYQAGTQNWGITQGSDGIMYFANNSGVLEFDGSTWELHPLPNGSVVRTVAYFNDKLYAGGFNEFGYFSVDERGQHLYVSLSDSLPKEQRDLGEIWRIFSTRDGVVFQSFIRMIIFKNDKVKIIDPPSSFGFSYFVNNVLYVVDRETGLYRLRGAELEMVHSDKSFYKENEISFIIPNSNNSLLIGTTNNGIFKFNGKGLALWNVAVNKRFLKEQVYTGISLPGNQIAIGTIQDGLYVVDFTGNIVLHVNRFKGLQNNTVLSLYLDRHSNLWVGLDNGIDALEISSPISLINYCFNIETSYVSIVYDGILYIGTNQGLFAKKLTEITNQSMIDDEFVLVEGTMGQVWSLEIIKDELICGHNLGTFKVKGYTAKKISGIEGGWDYVEVPWDKNRVIGGGYNGLVLYEGFGSGTSGIKEVGLIKGFNESSKELYFDKNKYLWITHGYKGIFKVKLNDDFNSVSTVNLYNSSRGLPELPYSITEINDEFNIVARNGIYFYDQLTDSFKINHEFSSLFVGTSDLSRVVEDFRGDLWYFGSQELGVLRLQEDGTYSKIAIPFNRIKNQFLSVPFENVFMLDSKNVYIGSQQGMFHYNSEKTKDFKIPYKTLIGDITIKSRSKDSILIHKYYEQYKGKKNDLNIELPYRYNSISFQFMTPYFEAPRQISYSYRLIGFDEPWSPWSNLTNKEYTNLKEGDYTFEVRAKNIYNHLSTTASFEFSVRPPVYRTKLAFIIYGLSLIALVILNLIYFRKKLDKARELEKQRHKKELVEKEQKFLEEAKLSEEEIERLKNEKLLIEMRHKDMELANSTMHIIQKNKFLNKVKDDVHAIISKLSMESNKYALRQIVKRIDKDIKSDRQWKVFDKYFDEVHRDFTNRLKEQHPELTPKDLRLCSYLRMNISTKEIAPLMNISIRGVEISRYRLRKKLNLDRDLNLTEYIMSI